VKVSFPAGAFAPIVQARELPDVTHALEPGAMLPIARIVEPSATVTDCALAETSRRWARMANDGVAGAGTVTTNATSAGCTVGATVGVAAGLGVAVGCAVGVGAGFALEDEVGLGVRVGFVAGDWRFTAPPLHAPSASVKNPAAIADERCCIRCLPRRE
jgi:hypothetical protein